MKISCFFLSLLALFFLNSTIGQVNFFENVFPLLNKHCIKCHSKNGDAPFPLTTYEEVVGKAKSIKKVVEKKIMPPWPADETYRSFANENILSDEEILTIHKWVGEGMLQGKIQNSKWQSSNPEIKEDFKMEMPRKFTIEPSGKDLFKRFHIPSKIKEDINVYAFKFIPGTSIVHHTELFMDTTASVKIDFSNDSSFLVFGDDYEQKNKDSTYNFYQYISGWLPGINYEEYPAGTGLRIKKNSNFMFLIHYSPNPGTEYDKTKLLIYETNEKNIRYVETIALHANSSLVDGPLFLPADSVKTFHSKKTVEKDFSAFAVLPHAHHLAKSMLAYAVTPQNDTIHLLKINQWNFNWQFIYKFKKYIKLEKGTEIHFFSTYDNTSENPENPFNPTRNIGTSFNANDEMMEFFLLGIQYQNGDENLVIKYRVGSSVE